MFTGPSVHTRLPSVKILTHNSVPGACLLAPLYVQLLLLSCRVGVREPEVVQLCLWVLPVHLDRDLCLAENSDIINSRDIWEEFSVWWRHEVHIRRPALNLV